MQCIHMQLSKKKKTFSQSVSLFLEFRWNFENFQTKMTLVADVVLESQTPKDVVRQMSRKSRFRRPFDRWYCEPTKTLLKYGGQHLQHI